MDYALWSTRVLGFLIDSVFVLLAIGVLLGAAAVLGIGIAGLGAGLHAGGLRHLGGAPCCCLLGLFPLASLAIGLYNKVYLVAQRGSSIGQGIVKVRVVDAQGNLLTTGMALVRLLVHVALGFVPLGSLIDLLWPLWDERRQTLHDKAVGAYVINYRA